MDANVIAFLLNLAASMTWDGLKRILTKKSDCKQQNFKGAQQS